MSWRFVFNCNFPGVFWGHRNNAKQAAINAGYKFFCFGENVYYEDGSDTGIKIKDLF